MPLVDFTCSKTFYPPDPDLAESPAPTNLQQLILDLAQELPGQIVAHCEELNLDRDKTPIDGVQVDIHKFHGGGANTVDLWVCIVFAELYPGDVVALGARATLIQILTRWRDRHQLTLLGALDMFWGPDHGCLIPETGQITLFW